jgi:chromosomal replication initiator protein
LDLLEVVAEEGGIAVSDIINKGRKTEFVRARYVAMFLLKEYYGLSASEIARKLNRDHTSVLHGLKQMQELLRPKNAFLREQASSQFTLELLRKCENRILIK